MKHRGLVGPLIGILIAIIVAVAVVIPVAISVIGVSNTAAFGGYNLTSSTYSFAASAFTVAQLLPLLCAVLVLVGIAGYLTLRG